MAKADKNDKNTAENASKTTEMAPHATVAKPSTLQVTHAWRRSATGGALAKLWNAMELSRSDAVPTEGDENLQAQREAFGEFAKALLGADAPVMFIEQ